jgi:hypothetical protein
MTKSIHFAKVESEDPPPFPIETGKNGHSNHTPVGTSVAGGVTLRQEIVATTPLELFHAAMRECQLASNQIHRVNKDPASEIHGNLLVCVGALRRAIAVTQRLLEIEEGGK